MVQLTIAILKLFIVGDEEECFGGEIDDMALAPESVALRIVMDVVSAQEAYGNVRVGP
jgi:hypothetical protein